MRKVWHILLVFLLCSCSFTTAAAEVHVIERMSFGTVVTNTAQTGRIYISQTAPTRNGYLFTSWSRADGQALEARDAWRRAKDAVSFIVYEDTTLIANYVSSSLDRDGDGVADGYELYWYGDLDETATSDTDGDGRTFAEELAAGTNPLLPQYDIEGPIHYADGVLWQYNPLNKPAYTLRSEPEGVLFATQSEIVNEGTKITTGTYLPTTTSFAYWKINGVEQRDAWGRAKDSITLTMPTNAVEIVAVVSTGDSDGDGIADNIERYWYGDLDETATSDTDGDGKTFAEELAVGTNPLLPQWDVEGPVHYADGALWQYNPYGLQPYTLRSDPEGAFFATTNFYVKQGTKVTTETYGTATGFACWRFNGIEQRDAWGRALDTITFTMPTSAVELVAVKISGDTDGDGIADNIERYWYGDLDETAESDTDGDGRTFAEELTAGTNPLLPQYDIEGPVKYADSETQEMNLQPYEQPMGAVADGKFVELFTSTYVGNDATSCTFANGTQIWPVVADVNGDGLWDLIVCSATTTNVFINTGSKGNPQFKEEGTSKKEEVWNWPNLEMNSTAKLSGMTLDVNPINALSSTTNGTTMLVSDTEGRIWYYAGAVTSSTSQVSSTSYTLQHKVWGGSYAGFANGLMLAAVDWEDDGDPDFLCGTAEGKLMLLRNPKVGRPTNVRAEVGVDNVLLTWDPNEQSRIRGYKVYRAEGISKKEEGKSEEEENSTLLTSSFNLLTSTQLPSWRDTDLVAGTYGYKVSALSRFYTAGNSTPTETESPASEPVTATVGGVKFFWNDVVCKVGETASVMLSIENALNYDVAGQTQVVTYDPAYLEPVELIPSGLAEGVKYTSSFADGKWTISLTAGVLPAGSGKFFTLVFRTLKVGETTVGEAKVTIASAPTYQLGDVNGDGKVDILDLRLLEKLKSAAGRKYTSDQLRAGDFNGNGKLDNADYQALRELNRKMGPL